MIMIMIMMMIVYRERERERERRAERRGHPGGAEDADERVGEAPIRILPIPITRFRSFRIQPLENLGAAVKLPTNKRLLGSPTPGKCLPRENVAMGTGRKSPCEVGRTPFSDSHRTVGPCCANDPLASPTVGTEKKEVGRTRFSGSPLAAGAVEFVYRFCLCSQCGRCCALEPLRYCARLRPRA